MRKGKYLMQDGIKALGIGLMVSSLIGVVLFLCGLIFSRFTLLSALEVVKNGLLLLTAIGMFLIAGMLMVKGKKPEASTEKNGWKKHFHLMGYKAVMGIICIATLIVALAADYLLMVLK